MTRRLALRPSQRCCCRRSSPASPRAADSVPGPAPQELDRDDGDASCSRRSTRTASWRRRTRRACASSSTRSCCRISTPTTRRGSCSASTGGPRRRNSGSASSTRSTSRCCRNYGTALAEFTADRLTVLPFRGDLATRPGDRAHRGQAQQWPARAGQLHAAFDARRAGRPGTSRSRASPTCGISGTTSARKSTRPGSMR